MDVFSYFFKYSYIDLYFFSNIIKYCFFCILSRQQITEIEENSIIHLKKFDFKCRFFYEFKKGYHYTLNFIKNHYEFKHYYNYILNCYNSINRKLFELNCKKYFKKIEKK